VNAPSCPGETGAVRPDFMPLVLGLALSAAVLSAGCSADDPGRDGKSLFDQRCASCHTVEKLAPPLAARTPDARVDYLEGFLARHYAPDATERKLIAEWLSAAVQK
jgi:mono/diheme cytochrome c family protein